MSDSPTISPVRTRSSNSISDNDSFTSPQRTLSSPQSIYYHSTTNLNQSTSAVLYTPPANRISYIRGINTELILRKRYHNNSANNQLIIAKRNRCVSNTNNTVSDELPIRRNQSSASKPSVKSCTPLKSRHLLSVNHVDYNHSHNHDVQASINKVKRRLDTIDENDDTNKCNIDDLDSICEPDIPIAVSSRHTTPYIIEQSIDDIIELANKTNYTGFNFTDCKSNKLTLSVKLDRQRRRQHDINQLTDNNHNNTNDELSSNDTSANKRARAKLIFSSPIDIQSNHKKSKLLHHAPSLSTVEECSHTDYNNNTATINHENNILDGI